MIDLTKEEQEMWGDDFLNACAAERSEQRDNELMDDITRKVIGYNHMYESRKLEIEHDEEFVPYFHLIPIEESYSQKSHNPFTSQRDDSIWEQYNLSEDNHAPF